MTELYRHIGQFTDIPAGDIGVGGREIGYLFGQHKRITNQFTGVMTGKDPKWGGSLIRSEATGYGVVYFAVEMLRTRGDEIAGKTCLVSGSGNVAQSTVEKLIDLGARLVTMSDSDGFIHDPEGIDQEKLAWMMDLKNVRRGRIREYVEQFPGATYRATKRVARTRFGPLRPTVCSRARRRTRSPPKMPPGWSATAWSLWPKVPTCPQPRGALPTSSTPAFSTDPPRLPTPVEWPFPASRWHKTVCTYPGPHLRWTMSCSV